MAKTFIVTAGSLPAHTVLYMTRDGLASWPAHAIQMMEPEPAVPVLEPKMRQAYQPSPQPRNRAERREMESKRRRQSR
jgi:hypothetical protein